jgi:hypothetical protein
MLSFITISTTSIATMKDTMGEFFADLSPIFFIILGVILIIYIIRSFLVR